MIKFIQLAVILVLFLNPAKAQMSNTLYFMERIPQSQLLNPATQPRSNIYIGFPGISSYQINVGNSSLSLSSILQKGPNDSLIFFLDEHADKNLFFSDLKDRNTFFYNQEYQLFALGFRVKAWYFNMGVSLKNDIDLSYSKDLAMFLVNGFKIGDQFNFKNTGFNSSMYGELAVGASKIIDNDWTVGARIKIINGLFNIHTRSEGFSFRSVDNDQGYNQLIFDADINFDAYMPLMESTADTGKITVNEIFKFKNRPFKDYSLFENMGLGFDLGASYSGFDKIVLSASIIDLGYINWKKNTQNYRLRVDNYTFSGIDIDTDSMTVDTDEILDSLENTFSFRKFGNSYSTALPFKFYLAGEYFPVRYFSVGLLSLTQYYNKSFYQQVMMSANVRPLKMLMFSLSYSFLDNGFSSFGFGTALNLGATQFYLISDNIPFRFASGVPVPHKLKYFNLRFGFNFVFGSSEYSKKKDIPLNY